MSLVNIIPKPKKVEETGEIINIGEKLSVKACGDNSDIFAEAVNLFSEKLGKNVFGADGYLIEVKTEKEEKLSGAESYIVETLENKTVICGYDAPGVYYGVVTFLKLLQKEGNAFSVPAVKITDFPSFKIRGHFAESRCGSEFIDLPEWKNIIDYISENKCNTLMISVHGCWTRQWDFLISEHLHIPIKKYPELKTQRHIKYFSPSENKWIFKENVLPTMAEKDFFGDVIAYGKRKNVEVIPLFNSYGHNTMIPRIFPEMSAKDKDGTDTGFSICTECDKTYEIMFNIYDEIIERYLKPNGIKSISIGMDEVMPLISIDEEDFEKELSPFCECEKCRQFKHGELVMRFIIRAVKHLKEMGMENVYIYHDILFRNGMTEKELYEAFKEADILDVVVLDWWSYAWTKDALFGGRADEVSTCFRSVMKPWTGYYHWDVIEDTFVNIYEMSHLAEKKNFEGVITYDGFDYCFDKNISYLAEGAWNGSGMTEVEEYNREYAKCKFEGDTEKAAKAMEKLSLLTERTTPEGMGDVYFGKFLYYTYTYVRFNKEKGYRTAFPEEMFKIYERNPEAVKKFLSGKIEIADEVLELLKDDNSQLSKLHKSTALMYKVPANEMTELVSLSEKLKSGEIKPEEMAEKLEVLIKNRKELMALLEKTRIKGNFIYLLRSLSVSMQYIADIKEYLLKCANSGEKAEIDLTDLSNIKSELFEYLR